MEAVIGLVVMLLGVSHASASEFTSWETNCDGRKAGTQCYGPLGGTVAIQLMDDASEIPRYEWRKNTAIIFRGKYNNLIYNDISRRSDFTPSNGTFRISKLSRTDGGEYTLIMYNSDLQESGKLTLRLSVQAPVSSVLLVSECLSQGEMRVSCSSVGGDSPQYRWTLDGRELTDDELLSGNTESESITLKSNVSGDLACSVTNSVSGVCGFVFINSTLSTGTQISLWMHKSNDTMCIKPTAPPMTTDTSVDQSLLVCGLQAGGFILALTAIYVYFTCKRKKCKKAEASAVPQATQYPGNSVVMVKM